MLPIFKGNMKNNTKFVCMKACLDYKYAGVKGDEGDGCFCGDNTPLSSEIRPNEECNIPCPGNQSELCGGIERMIIHEIVGVRELIDECTIDYVCGK